MSFNLGISNILFASGKIALYQIVTNTLRLLAIVTAYFVLKSGADPQALFYTYIIFSVLIVFSTQWCLWKTLHYNVHNLVYQSYLPSITISLLFLVILFLPESWNGLINIIISTIYLLLLEYFIGLSTKEKLFIKNKIGHFSFRIN